MICRKYFLWTYVSKSSFTLPVKLPFAVLLRLPTTSYFSRSSSSAAKYFLRLSQALWWVIFFPWISSFRTFFSFKSISVSFFFLTSLSVSCRLLPFNWPFNVSTLLFFWTTRLSYVFTWSFICLQPSIHFFASRYSSWSANRCFRISWRNISCSCSNRSSSSVFCKTRFSARPAWRWFSSAVFLYASWSFFKFDLFCASRLSYSASRSSACFSSSREYLSPKSAFSSVSNCARTSWYFSCAAALFRSASSRIFFASSTVFSSTPPSEIFALCGWCTDPHTGHGEPSLSSCARIPACSPKKILYFSS